MRVSSASPTVTLSGSRARRSRGKSARHEAVAITPVGVQPLCTLRPEGQDRRLAGSTSTATPPRHQIHELVAISAKFFTNDNKKTLILASSAEEKRDVNQTSALGPLSTCMRQGNQAICRTQLVVLRSLVSCGKSSGPAQRTSSQTYQRSMTARRIR